MTLLGETVYVYHSNKVQAGTVLSVHIGLGSANGHRSYRQSLLDKLPTVAQWFEACAAMAAVKIELEDHSHINVPLSRVYTSEDGVPAVEASSYIHDETLETLCVREHGFETPYAIGQFIYMLAHEDHQVSPMNMPHPVEMMFGRRRYFQVPVVYELNIKPVRRTVVGYYVLKTKDVEEMQVFVMNDEGIVQGLKMPKPLYETKEDARAGLKAFEESFTAASKAMQQVMEITALSRKTPVQVRNSYKG